MAPSALSAPAPSVRGAEDVAAVLAARDGDAGAFGDLFTRWADRVHDLVARIVRDREAAADVTQEVFEVAWRRLPSLEQPEAFGGWLLRIARNRALDRIGRDRRTIPAGDAVGAAGSGAREPVVEDAAPARVEAAEAGALLWTASAALAPRDASILDLHLRHGMAAPEIADEIGVSLAAAHQVLHRLRGRLREAVRATVLWQDGAPTCPVLRADLREAGVERLDAVAVSVIGDHADRCDPCAEQRRARLAPEALFALAPLLALPPGAGASITHALTGASGGPPSPAAPGPIVRAAEAPGPKGPGGVDRAVGAEPHIAPAPASPAPGAPVPAAPTSVRPPRGGARRPRRAVAATAAATLLVLAAVVALLGAGDPGTEAAVASGAPTTTVVGVPRSGAAPASDAVAASPPVEDDAPAAPTAADGETSAVAAEEPAIAAGRGSSAGSAGSAGSAAPTPAEPSGGAPGSPEPSPGATGALGEAAEPEPAPSPPSVPPSIPPTVAPEAPVVISLTATRTPRPGCATPSEAIVVAWRSVGADQVGLTGPGAASGRLPASGTAVVCSPTAATYVLAASGPGGTTEAAVTVA